MIHQLFSSFCQALAPSNRPAFAAALLGSLYKMVIQVADTQRRNVAFPEIFSPIRGILSQVMKNCLAMPYQMVYS